MVQLRNFLTRSCQSHGCLHMLPERQLRKALEGRKNEPGPRRLPYEETEMRQHDTEVTSGA